MANTEQSLTQVTARQQETAARAERVSRERNNWWPRWPDSTNNAGIARGAAGRAAQRIEGLMAERQAAIERIEGLGGQISDWIAISCNCPKMWPEWSRVSAHPKASCGKRWDMAGKEKDGTALKTIDGVREALAEWLVIPPGLDRAVRRFSESGFGAGWWMSPSPRSRAVEFLKGKELGRGAFIPQQIRWAHEPADGDPSAAWWPTLNGQPGGRPGRGSDSRARLRLIHPELSV